MNTLLVAFGILASFGALFWLDRYYKDTGVDNSSEKTNGEDNESAAGSA